jgi:catechol 2,3-dioxygenase-like lactoylglutathione lyase family enzyme
MTVLNYILLAVENPRKSAELYSRVLSAEPVENSETFVLYVLSTGLKVGLWIRSEIEPAPLPAGGVEITFSEKDDEAVRQTYDAWVRLGLKIIQEPGKMDFGFTFVAADSDGHRLRVFAPA